MREIAMALRASIIVGFSAMEPDAVSVTTADHKERLISLSDIDAINGLLKAS